MPSYDFEVWQGVRALHSVKGVEALDILREARSRARKEPTGDSFVFPGERPKRPLSHMALALTLRRLGVKTTVHGFRTSFRTWCSEKARIGSEKAHVEFEVAEACLSHRVGSAVSRAYARSDMLERRRPVMSAWERYVTGTGDNVIQMRRA